MLYVSGKKFRSSSGSIALAPIILLGISITLFYVLLTAYLDEREKDIRVVSRHLGLKQLEARLNGVFQDPKYFNEVFWPLNNLRGDKADEVVAQNGIDLEKLYIPAPFALDASSGDLNDKHPAWIGNGAQLSYPNFDACPVDGQCPIKSYISDARFFYDNYQKEYLEFVISFQSLDVERTGAFNSEKPENKLKIRVPFGIWGLVMDEGKIFCAEGFRLLYMHNPPLEVLCKKL